MLALLFTPVLTGERAVGSLRCSHLSMRESGFPFRLGRLQQAEEKNIWDETKNRGEDGKSRGGFPPEDSLAFDTKRGGGSSAETVHRENKDFQYASGKGELERQ